MADEQNYDSSSIKVLKGLMFASDQVCILVTLTTELACTHGVRSGG